MRTAVGCTTPTLDTSRRTSTLRPEKNPTDFDLTGFGQVPVLVNGRIKPLDTVARTSLLTLQGRQRVSSPDTGTLVHSPSEWLATVFFNPAKADDLPTIRMRRTSASNTTAR